MTRDDTRPAKQTTPSEQDRGAPPAGAERPMNRRPRPHRGSETHRRNPATPPETRPGRSRRAGPVPTAERPGTLTATWRGAGSGGTRRCAGRPAPPHPGFVASSRPGRERPPGSEERRRSSAGASCTAGDVGGPVVHQLPPPLEQVRPRVGRLYPVLDDMGQRGLDHIARVVRLLGCPVPERRPETMWNGRESGTVAAVRGTVCRQTASRVRSGTPAGCRRRRASAPRRGSRARPQRHRRRRGRRVAARRYRRHGRDAVRPRGQPGARQRPPTARADGAGRRPAALANRGMRPRAATSSSTSARGTSSARSAVTAG